MSGDDTVILQLKFETDYITVQPHKGREEGGGGGGAGGRPGVVGYNRSKVATRVKECGQLCSAEGRGWGRGGGSDVYCR